MARTRFFDDYLLGKAKEADVLLYMLPWLKGQYDVLLPDYLGIDERGMEMWHYEPWGLKVMADAMRRVNKERTDEIFMKYMQASAVARYDAWEPQGAPWTNDHRDFPDDICQLHDEMNMSLAKAWRIHNQQTATEMAAYFNLKEGEYLRLENLDIMPYVVKKAIAKFLKIDQEMLNEYPYKPWTEDTKARFFSIIRQGDGDKDILKILERWQ